MFDIISDIIFALFERGKPGGNKEAFMVFPLMITFMIVALAIFSPFQFVWLLLILPLLSIVSKFLWPNLEKHLWYKVISTFLLVIIFLIVGFLILTSFATHTAGLISEF